MGKPKGTINLGGLNLEFWLWKKKIISEESYTYYLSMGGILYLRVRFLSLLSRGKNPSSHTPCDLHIFRFNGYSIGVGHIPKVRGQTGLLALS
jgi:hypothetical protein